jgi:1-phosphofructokinase family hexose kinase
MIAVIGLNTAIDKLLDVDDLTRGLVIRARAVRAWPGGKGVHAAMCAAALGERVRLTGLVDAPHRASFDEALRARGVEFHAVNTPGPLRTCLAIRDRSGCITEILEPGPSIDAEVCETALRAALTACRDVKVAVFSGSLPPGMSSSTYRGLVSELANVRAVVDASGDLLRNAIEAGPYCIKPNRAEAEALTGTRLDSPAAAACAGRSLLARGVRLVVISLGAGGAIACWNNRAYHFAPPEVAAVNAVGAGDCLAGALAAGLARGDDLIDAVRLAIAAATAKVLSPEIGLVRRADIDALAPTIRVSVLL